MPTDPLEHKPAGAERYMITPRLDSLWRDVEACSGHKRDIHTVRFYLVDSIRTGVAGRYQYNGHAADIYIIRDYEFSARAWRHEIMHALLYHVKGHPRRYFAGQCGALLGVGDK